jgi:hypothetical protein
MERSITPPTVDTTINRYKKILNLECVSTKNNNSPAILSKEQWKSFADLANDLELNDQGIQILYQEVHSGRVLLPCDRNNS